MLTWSSIVWKAATDRSLFDVWPLPWLGREAAKVITSLPSSWRQVRGPIGAAYLSLKRIGWTFSTPFQITDSTGRTFSLTDTAPALLAHFLRESWNHINLVGASRALHLDPDLQIDFEVPRRLLQDRSIPARSRQLILRYLCHAIWTRERLYHVGFDVPHGCERCGHHRDDLHHRLFRCTSTEELRKLHLEPLDIDHLQARPYLVFGCQAIPPLPAVRVPGLGHQEFQSYTVDGRPIELHFKGAILYSDGSCATEGHRSQHRAGWSLVKIADDGTLIAAAWGAVGALLPQTASASEYIAGLAAAVFSAKEVRADFSGVAAIASLSSASIGHRKSMYSGVKIQIRGRCPNMVTEKVPGHAALEALSPGSEDWINGVGNDIADRHARKGAALHGGPASQELQLVAQDRALLKRFLTYTGEALQLWEAIGPAKGARRKALPRLDSKPELCSGARGRTFRHDVLGPWIPMAPQDAQPSHPPPTDSAPEAGVEGPVRRRLRGKQPARNLLGYSGVPPKHSGHQWRFRRNHWACAVCLKMSRKDPPSRTEACPGYSQVMRDLFLNPHGHALHFSRFLDESGICICCFKCGRYCTSNRKNQALAEVCLNKPSSTGVAASLVRLKALKHPLHPKGEHIVFEPWAPLEMLRARGAD